MLSTEPNSIASGAVRVWSAHITRDNGVTDRCLRKWIATGRFPHPDGNLNGRNFWEAETYRRWKADVLDGKYRKERRPGNLTSTSRHEPRRVP
jgi:hypothetical protein